MKLSGLNVLSTLFQIHLNAPQVELLNFISIRFSSAIS